MVAYEKSKFWNIQENWRHLARKLYCKKYSRYRVDLNYIEEFLMQLMMPVIFTGSSTGTKIYHIYDLLNFGQWNVSNIPKFKFSIDFHSKLQSEFFSTLVNVRWMILQGGEQDKFKFAKLVKHSSD